MLRLQVRQTSVAFGEGLEIHFLRAPRAADETVDGADQPDCGEFPVFCATDYPRSVPAAWRAQASLFIPIYPHEAMWMRFSTYGLLPTAMKIGIDGFDALTGSPWHERLLGEPQNYLVCPDQERLDGYEKPDGLLRQFTLTSANWEYGCRGKAADGFESTQIRLMAFAPRKNPAKASLEEQLSHPVGLATTRAIVAGGPITPCMDKQVIATRPDRYGIHTWDCLNYCALCIYLISDLAFRQITLRKPPPSTVPIRQNRNDSHTSRRWSLHNLSSRPGNGDRGNARYNHWGHNGSRRSTR